MSCFEKTINPKKRVEVLLHNTKLIRLSKKVTPSFLLKKFLQAEKVWPHITFSNKNVTRLGIASL